MWQTNAIRVELVDVPAGVRMRGHGHDEPHLCFIAAGAFDERDAAGRHRLAAAGTLRGSPAGDEHDLTFRAPSSCLLVLFADGAIEPPAPRERRWLVDERAQRLARSLGHRVGDADASPLELEMLALELMAAASSRRGTETGAWLRRVRERIDDRPEAPPTTRELAADAGVHPVYVARAFRAAFGIGIGEYARLVRAEHARRMLTRASTPLARLALSAGYSDQSHMTREMRRFLGVTPIAVRRGGARIREVADVQDGDVVAATS